MAKAPKEHLSEVIHQLSQTYADLDAFTDRNNQNHDTLKIELMTLRDKLSDSFLKLENPDQKNKSNLLSAVKGDLNYADFLIHTVKKALHAKQPKHTQEQSEDKNVNNAPKRRPRPGF